MSFDRSNTNYRSLPDRNINNAQKTVNFSAMQPPASSITTMSTSICNKVHIPITTSTTNMTTSSSTSTNANQEPINTEEFAKLDALLEDLLAEVEQPILLNKQDSYANNFNTWNGNKNVLNKNANISNNINDIERSVDWLNEQKEILRSRKEISSKVHHPKVNDILINEDENNNNNDINQQHQPYRKIKSKLDYYLSSSNTNGSSPLTASNKNNNFSYNNNSTFSKQFANEENFGDDQIDSLHLPINNKPPVSPNSRMMYSPTSYLSQQTQQTILLQPQQQQSLAATGSFRSLSTNPILLKNIHELDDDGKQLLDPKEFDRYSQRSFRSNTSTVQRTKYHTVSNDYVECTRPLAPTPVPQPTINSSGNSGTNRQQYFQSKRALSAPPTEIGKVVLQRMELKSPLTVRQNSIVPFEHEQQQFIQPSQQQMPNKTINRQQYIDNPYNNRGILKSNTYATSSNGNQQLLFEPTTTTANSISIQPQTRNVFLNRSYSEAPRGNGFTNGYETDSGIITSNGYNSNTAASYRTNPQTYNPNSSASYRMNDGNVSTSSMRNTNAYRTIGPTTAANRYQIINDQSGYDTDTGLIKLRQVLDNRRASSRNGIPIQQIQQQQIIQQTPNGYYYQNRSITPSFSQYNNSYGTQLRGNQFNNQSNVQIPINDTRFNDMPQERISSPFMVGSYPTNMLNGNNTNGIAYIDQNTEFIQQPHQIQFVNANGVITNTVPGYLTPDGRQIILQDVDSNIPLDFNNNLNSEQQQQQQYFQQQPQQLPQQYQQQSTTISQSPAPKSLIIQQKVAPSAYQSSAFHSATASNANNSSGSLTQINQDPAPQNQQQTRLTSTSSAVNLSASQIQKPAQQLNREVVGSVTSLPDSNEILRNYPKSIKTTQNFWYKPKISRDEAIALLKDKIPGTFLIRDSNNFPGAYGLALKVDKPPANVQIKPGSDPLSELVRHFLIEPTNKGVRIKGCCNEPIFGNLAALVYQHSLTPLALPIKLILPTQDLVITNDQSKSESNNPTKTNQIVQSGSQAAQQQQNAVSPQGQDARLLLEKGAACNVYFLNTVNVENKNGLEAISHALSNTKALANKDSSQLLLIQFKVTAQGVTLTDLNRKKFIRQHFPTNTVVYCAVEEKLTWPLKIEKISKPRIFGLICKPKVTSGNNECHLFVEIDPDQPAIAIVDFINRYLIPSKN